MLSICTPHDLALSNLGKYWALKGMHKNVKRLCRISPNWKLPRCSSTGKWINCDMFTQRNTKQEFVKRAKKSIWMQFMYLELAERSGIQACTNYTSLSLYVSRTSRPIRAQDTLPWQVCVCAHVCNDWKKCSVSRLGVGYKTGIQLVKFHQALCLICIPCHRCITCNKKLFLLEMIIKMYVHLANLGKGKKKMSKW